MPDKLTLSRRNLQTILQALAAAKDYASNTQSEYLTLKQFIAAHPGEQVFELVIRKEKQKRHA